MSGISGCRSGVLAIVVGLLLLGSVPGEAFLGDSSSHPPPTAGGYAYYSTYGSFGPDQPGFPGRGQSYVDPVFGTTLNQRLARR